MTVDRVRRPQDGAWTARAAAAASLRETPRWAGTRFPSGCVTEVAVAGPVASFLEHAHVM